MNTPTLYDIFIKNPRICIDDRKAEQGSIFFAIKGDNFDGNDFAEKALEKCVFAIVDNPDVVKNDRYILVDNSLCKLQSLAKFHRKRLGLPIIAITGTNGKTTTKELVASVMSKKYKVAHTQGNLNNHIGVPLTLLSFTKDHEFGIVEMGANHIEEIEKLCKITAPDFGIITNIGKAHLEGFGSFEGVKKAKSELFKYLYDNDGVAFVNYDNEYLEDMQPPHSVVYYGTKEFTHCQGREEDNGLFIAVRWVASDDENNENDNIEWEQETRLIKTNLFGRYNFENVLAAICIGNNFNISDIEIKQAIESYHPKNNRSQVVETSKNRLIIDSYNANPSSMKAAIDNFGQIVLNDKVLILADMFELGTSSMREHGVVISNIQEYSFSQVILVGKSFNNYSSKKEYAFFIDAEELIDYITQNPILKKNVLIKGSNGMQLDKIIPYL